MQQQSDSNVHPPPESWETLDRLFGKYPRYAPTLAQQGMLIRQLDFWRSLGFDEFRRLTAFNRVTRQLPVYQIGELPLDMLFMTFTKLHPQSVAMTLRQIQSYWLDRFSVDSPTVMRCCIKLQQDGTYHWHVLVKFARAHLFPIYRLRLPSNLGPNSSILPVLNWQSAWRYVGNDGPFVDWEPGDQVHPMEQEQPDPASMNQEWLDHAPPPFEVLLPQPPPQSSTAELPTTVLEIVNLFSSASFDTFVKTMRDINKSNGRQGPDCYTIIEKRLKK